MGTPLQSALDAYKKAKQDKKEKSRLLSKDLDYLYLQKLLNSMAEDQQRLMIVIKLTNGTQIEIKKQEKNVGIQRDPYREVIQ